MRRWIFNAVFFAAGMGAIFLVFAIGNANHSRSFQTATEKVVTLTTLWAIPIMVCTMAALASIPLKRTNAYAPWPIAQGVFLVVVSILLFTSMGERLTSGKHIGDIAIFLIYALAVSSLASSIRNVLLGISRKQFAKVVLNAIFGVAAFVMVLTGTCVFLYVE